MATVFQPKVFNVPVNENGVWTLDAGKDFLPGIHTVKLVSVTGQQKDLGYFVVHPAPTPTKFSFYWLALLFLLFIIIVSVGTWISEKRAHQAQDEHIEKRWRKYAIGVAIISVIIFAVVVLWETAPFEKLSSILSPSTEVKLINVVGSIKNPITDQGVSDVDLTVSNQTVRTTVAGAYAFVDVAVGDAIRINHPELKVSLVKKVDESGKVDILLDPSVFNTVFEIIQFEAGGQFEKIYDYLAPQIQSQISANNFANSYETIFTSGDVSPKELFIGETNFLKRWSSQKYNLIFEQVFSVTVEKNGQRADYRFVFIDDRWKLIQ